jgi:hypothetical protein
VDIDYSFVSLHLITLSVLPKAWIKKRLEIPQAQPEVINGRTDNVIKCKETKE